MDPDVLGVFSLPGLPFFACWFPETFVPVDINSELKAGRRERKEDGVMALADFPYHLP